MESLAQILGRTGATSLPQQTDAGTKFDFVAWQRKRAELFNSTEGSLTGYECPECKNRGYFMRVEDSGQTYSVPCKCQAIRNAMAAMERCGLPKQALADCTWENWETPENWQKSARETAQAYVRSVLDGDHGSFVISGTPGAGKTKLCSTVFRALVEGGVSGRYLSWRDFARQAKSYANDDGAFSALVAPAKTAKLLYLDDFWKGSITPADVNLAFEIINARYAAHLPTILSSEHTLEAIVRGDEAIGSRLLEMAGANYINCARAENWRKRKQTTASREVV